MNNKAFLKNYMLLFFLLVIPGFPAAQDSAIKFSQISEEQGLASPFIGGLYQDKQGFIWIGSFHSALYRYDGRNIKVFQHDPDDPDSVPAVKYGKMHLDDSNVLWIATINGLVSLDLETEKTNHYTHDPRDPLSISPGNISAIYEDSPGRIWLGTSEHGLSVLNKNTGEFNHYRHDPGDPGSLAGNEVFSLEADGSGNIWIGTDAGASVYNRETGVFSHFRHNPADPGSISNNCILSIELDHLGTLWLATRDGLNALEPGKDDFRRFYIDGDNSEYLMTPHIVYEGGYSGRLWTPVNGIGLFEFDRDTEEFNYVSGYDPGDPHSLSSDYIEAILEDQSGMLWVGGKGGFLNSARLNRKEFYYLRNEPKNPGGFRGLVAKDFAEDDAGFIWVASLGGGLQVFDREEGKIIKRYTHDEQDPGSLLSNDAYSLLADDSGTIWVGTRNGVSRLDKTSGKFFNFPEVAAGAHTIMQDSGGDIWASGWTGLNRFDKESNRFVPASEDPDNLMRMAGMFGVFEDSRGNILMATLGYGYLLFNRQTGELTSVTHNPEDPGSLSTNEIYSIFEDSRHILWFATNMGLNRYDEENEVFIHYTHNDGLSSNTVYDMTEDDQGNIWIMTSGGITKYDYKKDSFRSYDTSDGILGGDHFGRIRKSREGILYFSGIGINYFDPAKISENKFIPPVVITDLKLFNKRVPVGEFEKGRSILEKSINVTGGIELLSRDYIVTFEFSALSFVDSFKNRYAYILEGFEDEWINSGTRNFATYTNLAPGDYTLRIKGTNNDGKWNEAGVSLEIRILPPFWLTLWFRIVLIILFILLFLLIFIYTAIRFQAGNKARMLKREVSIARRIQTSLLPDLENFRDSGYDFEARMDVAESVGGDYYDVLRGMDGRLWLAIGDVSGHGIPAGLVMVMAQVGIHNLLENISGITPDKLLTQVNKVMTNHIRRKMRSDHYMTINLLMEKAPGHFLYAGAHEIILIHRAKTGEVIQLDTGGFWLGILDDCSKQMGRGTGDFQLEKNDTLLLYTDGLIEVMNKKHEQFNIKRLKDIMSNNCESPRILKGAINNAMAEFGGVQKDDITYLICRRK